MANEQLDQTADTGNTSSSLNDDQLSKSLRLSIIAVYGDGRCLFRCAAIHDVKVRAVDVSYIFSSNWNNSTIDTNCLNIHFKYHCTAAVV